jgi:hypothetical protein
MRVRAIAFTTTVLLGLAALILAGADPGPRVNLQWPYPPSDASPPPATLGNPQKMLPYFDDYSWKTFLAMVWPAARGRRGVPDERQTVASQMKPKVFETFKAAWEVFHADKNGHLDGSPPADWNYYDQGKYNACSQNVQFGDLVLASFSKFTDVGQAGFGTLDPALCGGRCGPLMARNFTFLHYLTGYNEPVFLQVQAQQLYLHVQPGVGFQASQEPGKSALTVKSSWMEMRDFDAAHQARYYTRDDVWVRGTDGICRKEKVGLVGLHIVQRTLSRTQWIWTSFEQVDNVPPPDPLGSDGTFAL